ncbi:MAG: site-specific integrase [Bacteroidia bacterium]|nr:site-specific integrase [Bacteroidia bacterium]
MAKVNFILKDKHSSETTLILTFAMAASRKKFYLSERVNPKHWDQGNKENPVKKSYGPGYSDFNARLRSLKADVLNTEAEMKLANEEITWTAICDRVASKVNGDFSTVDFFQAYNEFMQVMRLKLKAGTLKRYSGFLNHLKRYELKFNRKITFEGIDQRFFDHFTGYLQNDLGLINNTTGKQVMTLKTFLYWATIMDYNSRKDFERFPVFDEPADIIYLTNEELESLLSLDLSKNEKLASVRDVFCFACFTGQRFGDIKGFRREDIHGDEWHLTTEKTKDNIIVPLLPQALEILAKYANQDRPLPVISNQKTNDYLKELGKIAGINSPVTITKYRGSQSLKVSKPKYDFISTHCGRRTFVTLSLEKGMRPEVVMEITGHKSYKIFKKYIKLVSEVKKTELRAAWMKGPRKAV